MAKAGQTKSVVDLVAGLLCIASAGLNGRNMVDTGISGRRFASVGVLTLIRLFSLVRYFKTAPDEK